MKWSTPSHVAWLALTLSSMACGTSEGSDADASGSDSSDAGGEGGDTSTGGSPSTPPPTIGVKTSSETDVPGFESRATATVTVSDDSEVAYRWRLESVPEDSELDEKDLDGANTASVSFVPDRGGEYVLRVEVTARGASKERSVVITPPTYAVPFILGEMSETQGSSEQPFTMKSGGEKLQAIGCRYNNPLVHPYEWTVGEIAIFSNRAQRLLFPAEVGGTSVIATTITTSDNPAVAGSFIVASSDTRCGGALQPQKITGIIPHGWTQAPRFSPNGRRIVAVNDGDPDDTLETFGVDDTTHRLIKTWPSGLRALEDRSAGDYGVATHATWLSNTELAWIDSTGPERVIYRAADQAGATPNVMMSCPSGANDTILNTSQLEIRNDVIFVIVDGRLYALTRDESDTFSCDREAPTNLVLTPEDFNVLEFDIDPQGSNIVFAGTPLDDPETEAIESDALYFGSVWRVPADGSKPPVRVSPDDGDRHNSPHFALNGRQIVWAAVTPETIEEEDPDNPPATRTYWSTSRTRLMRANADGSHRVVILEQDTPGSDGAKVQLGESSGSSCSFGVPFSSSGTGALAAALASLALVRRGRRRVEG